MLLDLENDRIEHPQKGSELTFSDDEEAQKRSELTLSAFPSLTIRNVYELIKFNRKAKYSTIADNIGVSESTAKRAIAWLKENGYINSEHSKIKGEWQLL